MILDSVCKRANLETNKICSYHISNVFSLYGKLSNTHKYIYGEFSNYTYIKNWKSSLENIKA